MRRWPALAIPLLAVAAAGPAPDRARGGPAETAFVACWQRDVSVPCARQAASGRDAAVERCTAELGETKCGAERAAYEKELAAALAQDVLDLLAASIKRVCAAEAASGDRAASEEAIAAGWRDALDVRSEFMRACAAAGRAARDCDDRANEAERRARDQFCAR